MKTKKENKNQEREFWTEAWQARQLGFHQQAVNPYLIKYFSRFQIQNKTDLKPSLFIPLCGKTLDLLWPLTATPAMNSIGVEFVPMAVQEFFTENHLKATLLKNHDPSQTSASESSSTPTSSKIQTYQCVTPTQAQLTVFEGDFFALTPQDFKNHNVTAIFDRAALVALPPETRKAYAQHMRQLFAPTESHPSSNFPSLLLISFEHAGGPSYGPPYSVSEEEVHELYKGMKIEFLFKEEIKTESKNLNKGGVNSLMVKGYLITAD